MKRQNDLFEMPLVAIVATTLVLSLFTASMSFADDATSEQLKDPGKSLLTLPKPRQGYYIGLGAAGAVAGFHHKGDGWLPPFFGGGGSLHVGQGLSDRVAIGLDIGAYSGTNDDRTMLMGHVALELNVSIYKGWFIRPSIGFGFEDFYRRDILVKKITGTISGAYTVSAGYDFFIHKGKYNSGGIAVSPMVWINGGNGVDLNHLAGGIGIEITLWNGLDKNQLVLPADQAFQP